MFFQQKAKSQNPLKTIIADVSRIVSLPKLIEFCVIYFSCVNV